MDDFLTYYATLNDDSSKVWPINCQPLGEDDEPVSGTISEAHFTISDGKTNKLTLSMPSRLTFDEATGVISGEVRNSDLDDWVKDGVEYEYTLYIVLDGEAHILDTGSRTGRRVL